MISFIMFVFVLGVVVSLASATDVSDKELVSKSSALIQELEDIDFLQKSAKTHDDHSKNYRYDNLTSKH